jgi:Domain of unknown function (DUF2017)
MGLFDRHSPFKRRKDGSFAVELSEVDRKLLGDLVAQLRTLLTTDSPALTRLFPPAYGDDAERSAGYAALAGSELVERRLAALTEVEETIDATTLTEDELATWMRSVNGLRLVLGTILDVDEDHILPDPQDESAPLHATYEYLGYLLERMVEALSG